VSEAETDAAGRGQTTRWVAVCAYDGTDFEGWQSQSRGRGIQDVIERGLREVAGVPVRIHGAGRTDAGVHARGQVFHFDLQWKHGAGALRKAVGRQLPETIQLLSLGSTGFDFHARFSAVGKRYVYQLATGEVSPFEVRYWTVSRSRTLDHDAITRLEKVWVGSHDFTAFSAKAEGGGSPIKRITSFRVEANASGDRLSLVFEGSGFLYKMIRFMSGAAMLVGAGKLTVEAVAEILASGERTPRLFAAPARGLVLDEVFYPDFSGIKGDGKAPSLGRHSTSGSKHEVSLPALPSQEAPPADS